jgi:SAM-dependent methyltransferase
MADHPVFAAVYDRLTAPSERAGLAARRQRLLADAAGRVLEIGGGTGANLPHYRGVESVTVMEPSAAMRRRLLDRVASAPVRVEVHEAGVEAAPFPDGSFDTVVSTLTLCSVSDLVAGLAQIRRLLAPEGSLLFMEHVTTPGWHHRVQVLADPLWGRVAGGCHLDRDIPALLRQAGFAVTDCERFRMPFANPLIGAAVQGRAVVSRRAA